MISPQAVGFLDGPRPGAVVPSGCGRPRDGPETIAHLLPLRATAHAIYARRADMPDPHCCQNGVCSIAHRFTGLESQKF